MGPEEKAPEAPAAQGFNPLFIGAFIGTVIKHTAEKGYEIRFNPLFIGAFIGTTEYMKTDLAKKGLFQSPLHRGLYWDSNN